MNPMEELIVKAESGDVEAQFDLAEEYWEKGDYEQAFLWYKKVAEQGSVEAQFNLGVIYDNDQGVLQDYELAFHWYKKSADQGNMDAQFNLGLMY